MNVRRVWRGKEGESERWDFVEFLSDKGSALDLKQRPRRSPKANDALTRVCVWEFYCRIETAEGKSGPRRMGG